MTTSFGGIIREWRQLRRFSQLQLSLEAGLSSRHLSFLESGRAQPSRSMVLRLADALAMPKDVANSALHIAGFAPAFPSLKQDDAALQPVRAAVEHMLRNHAPFPAVAIDRWWTVTSANAGAAALFSALRVSGAVNMIELLIAVRDQDVIENWDENAHLVIARLKSEIAYFGGDDRLNALRQKLTDALPNGEQSAAFDSARAVIPTKMRLGENRLSLFSTIAHFGSVQDVNASDIRIELMFPADEATRNFFMNT